MYTRGKPIFLMSFHVPHYNKKEPRTKGNQGACFLAVYLLCIYAR